MLGRLATGRGGLNTVEAVALLERDGPNDLEQARRTFLSVLSGDKCGTRAVGTGASV